MDDLTVHLALPGPDRLLADAVPVVQRWLTEWSDYGTVTIALTPAARVETVDAGVTDAAGARAAVLRAVLRGIDRAALLSALLGAIRRRIDPPVIVAAGDPPPAGGGELWHFESFGAGEMAVFMRVDEDAFDDLEGTLEAMLGDVASLQEPAYHDGVGQWVLGG
ncbi:hypothetical protein ACFPIJ_04990 [Dactylosporangium cerinum]|uniref:Uncharacterized protein n=1 Tax=Dactylosporangium cerinum TaxID=1434730 RepID=A0ABV9VLC7_9ACTN